jgi:hypothetical protein
MDTPGISTLIAKLQSIAQEAPKDRPARKKLYDAAQSLATALESPDDTVWRIAYQVRSCLFPCPALASALASDLPLIKISTDLKHILTENIGQGSTNHDSLYWR